MKTQYIAATNQEASILLDFKAVDNACEGFLIEIDANLQLTLKASYKSLQEAKAQANTLNI